MKIKKLAKLILLAVLAAVSALNYAIFIFPNQFAPAGLDGICTMIQDITGISIGYLALAANIPLLMIAWFKLDRDYVAKSIIKRNTFESVLMRWMNLEPIIQSEVSQKEKDKYHILMHIFRI